MWIIALGIGWLIGTLAILTTTAPGHHLNEIIYYWWKVGATRLAAV